MMEDESNTSCEEKGSELPPGIPIDWEAWLATQGPRLLLFARQQARREHEAEDILQDALVKLVRKVESGALPRIPECWAAYVYKVIHSLAINYGKKTDLRLIREGEAYMESEHIENSPWLQSESDLDALKKDIETRLRDMPSKFSEVVILRIWGDLTFREIAETLDIPLNTVTSRYRYGIAHLRKSVSEIADPQS